MVQCMSLLYLLASIQATMAVISEQCQKETETLGNNTALLAAFPPTLNCNINLDETNSCQVDYSPYSSNYEAKCLAAGGQFHETDYTLDCKVAIMDKNFDANYYFLNSPLCLGNSCTLAEYEEELEAAVYPEAERELSLQGFQCSVSGGASWEPNLLSVSIVSVLVSALSIFGSLF